MDVGLVKDVYAKVCWFYVVTLLHYVYTYISLVFDKFILRTDIKMTCATMRVDNVIKL